MLTATETTFNGHAAVGGAGKFIEIARKQTEA
jgi:hypothetical protein